MGSIDVFVDFTGATVALPEAMARLAAAESLGAVAERMFCAAPRSRFSVPRERREGVWRLLEMSAVDACGRAMSAAADAGRPLLVLPADVEPGCDAVGVLLAAFDDDPMIGFAAPRLSGFGGDGVAALDDGGDPAVDELPR